MREEKKTLKSNTNLNSSEVGSSKVFTEEINTNIRVHSYRPDLFKKLRDLDNISDALIMSSTHPEFNQFQIFKQDVGADQGTGGSSGSFFFFTEDKEFIIKTINKSEATLMV